MTTVKLERLMGLLLKNDIVEVGGEEVGTWGHGGELWGVGSEASWDEMSQEWMSGERKAQQERYIGCGNCVMD
jgi:hypothetical protein